MWNWILVGFVVRWIKYKLGLVVSVLLSIYFFYAKDSEFSDGLHTKV